MLVVSVYLEMLTMVLAFIYLANYKYEQMNPFTSDVFGLTLTLYFIVLIRAVIYLVKQAYDKQNAISTMELKQRNLEKGNLLVRSDRKTVKILYDDIMYIESLGDYVKIFSSSRQTTITREKISILYKRLPTSFLRIHRSFIVNTDKVLSYSKETLNVDSHELPISRTFKVGVMEKLEQRI
jgi:DNA-binding LytR/AlgR family response regulator